MTPDEVLALLEQSIGSAYPTGIGWAGVEDDTLDIDWVGDASTQITIAVRNFDPATKRWVTS
jgi:hypothetical protein